MADQQFTFFPDGRVAYSYLVKNPDAPDFEAIQRDHPEALGAYGLEGGKLNIVLGGDADEWNPLTFEVVGDDRLKLNGIPTFRAKPFGKGFLPEARYTNIDAAGISDQNRSQSDLLAETTATLERGRNSSPPDQRHWCGWRSSYPQSRLGTRRSNWWWKDWL